ncbi:MAG: hypothetical protein MJZ35_05035 [Bacteroidaceae bacterium]|nr:hypothetical protein [Bacteroidaceae bacterium]
MKTIKNLRTAGILTLSLCMSGAMLSCGESAKERAQREKIDSLEMVNKQGRLEYEDLQEYLTVLSDGLDSITIEEQEIVMNATPGEGKSISRKKMKEQLDHAREILARHRERITELEKKLANAQGDAKKLRTIISALKEQVEQKEKELEQLRIDLDDSRKDIAELRNTVVSMQAVQDEQQTTIGQQQQTISEQKNTIQQQDAELNTGYIRMGSPKELKADGLLSGGFLQKKKVDYSHIDLSKFDRIDIRTTRQLNLPRKAKILTAVPEGSYELDKQIGGTILTIKDPARFWSVSNFLIIQTN